MRIDFRCDGIVISQETRELIASRVRFAIGRFSPAIEEVRVVLSDSNGPRRGGDQRCAVTVRTGGGVSAYVEASADTVASAVDLASERAARSTRRLLDLRREYRRESIRTTEDRIAL